MIIWYYNEFVWTIPLGVGYHCQGSAYNRVKTWVLQKWETRTRRISPSHGWSAWGLPVWKLIDRKEWIRCFYVFDTDVSMQRQGVWSENVFTALWECWLRRFFQGARLRTPFCACSAFAWRRRGLLWRDHLNTKWGFTRNAWLIMSNITFLEQAELHNLTGLTSTGYGELF